jgi:outer membrane beta-barrel protein
LVTTPALADDDDLLGPDAVAQDDDEESDDSTDEKSEDDILKEILGEDTEESVASEQEAVRSGDLDDRVGVQSEVLFEEEAAARRRVIKTIQAKNFLKLGRFEASPFLGFVTNDPFIYRRLAGLSFAYHMTEIFALELMLGYSPDLGQADWKPLTRQLVDENKVSPDISKLTLFTHAAFQFSPIYGKIAINGRKIVNFDVFGTFGMGFTRTIDDLEALGDDSSTAQATAIELHATTNIGGGARVIINQNWALRAEGRSLVYIETINSTTLEMKNNFVVSLAASYFFPGMR